MTSNPLIRVQGNSSGFGYDAVVELRSGGCNGNLIGCSNSTGSNQPELLYAQNLIIGTTYYIRVYGYYGNYPGLFKILVCSSVVSNNDECSGATPIAQEKYYLPIPGNSFISQSIPVGPCGRFADDDMWYKFVALTSNPIIRVTGYGNYDAVIELRSGNCNGTVLSCVNNTGKTGTEYLYGSNLIIGSIYYVRVYDNQGIPGIFEIGVYGN